MATRGNGKKRKLRKAALRTARGRKPEHADLQVERLRGRITNVDAIIFRPRPARESEKS